MVEGMESVLYYGRDGWIEWRRSYDYGSASHTEVYGMEEMDMKFSNDSLAMSRCF